MPMTSAALTELEIQLFGGDQDIWGTTKKINQAGTVTFKCRTNVLTAKRAIWQVAQQPFTNNPVVVASGQAGIVVPGPGYTKFSINVANFAPPLPPPGVTTYYVRVLLLDASSKVVGPASAPASLAYQAGDKPVSLDFNSMSWLVHPELNVPLPISIELLKLKCIHADEGGGDEPYLIPVAVYLDGTTIKVFPTSSRHARIQSPAKTQGNLIRDPGSDALHDNQTIGIPVPTGQFATSILPIGLEYKDKIDADTAQSITKVAILVVAMEEDSSPQSSIDAARDALVANLQSQLDAILQNGVFPAFDASSATSMAGALQSAVEAAAKADTLSDWWKPWVLLEIGNPDDIVGVGYKLVSYADIKKAGYAGIPFSLDFNGSGSHYTVEGNIGMEPAQ